MSLNKKELLKAINKLQNSYDASFMGNWYSWEEEKNSHANEFKILKDAELNGEFVDNAIDWIHDRYDCYYKRMIEEDKDNPFNYLRGVINE